MSFLFLFIFLSFWYGPFLKSLLNLYNIASFFFFFLMFKILGHKACRILPPWPGIKPIPLHWKVTSLPLDYLGTTTFSTQLRGVHTFSQSLFPNNIVPPFWMVDPRAAFFLLLCKFKTKQQKSQPELSMIHSLSLIHQAPPHLNNILSYKELWELCSWGHCF